MSFTSPEVMWTLIMKLPCTEMKYHPEVKSQTSLSSLRVSCKRALSSIKGINRLISKMNVSHLLLRKTDVLKTSISSERKLEEVH